VPSVPNGSASTDARRRLPVTDGVGEGFLTAGFAVARAPAGFDPGAALLAVAGFCRVVPFIGF
jgi:hypothetical protein